jgi:putative phage-type endonuclease
MQQNTPEWLEMRKKYIGASDAPIIMGVSPWATPLQLWERKLNLCEEKTQTQAMKSGNDLEPIARENFEKIAGVSVVPKVIFHPRNKWMMASMDGISSSGKTAVEIKCPFNPRDHETALKGEIPEKYVPQLQHQMEVCDLDRIFYYSYYQGKGVLLELDRHERYIQEMLREEESFYRCMKEMEPPRLTDRDFIERWDSEWQDLATQWATIQQQMKIYQDQEEELRKRLILISGGMNTTGCGLRLTKVVRKGSVDYKSIPELKNVDLDQYRKEPSLSFRIGEK